MSGPLLTTSPAISDMARRRLLSAGFDPFLFADWQGVVFIHFLINPDVLRPHVPAPFELELYQGQACISLVALTMRRFRPCGFGSLAAWLFRPVPRQCFLNLRTYVRWRDEPGAFFLWGWLSKPFGLRLPVLSLGLPYGFGSLDYDHSCQTGTLKGVVIASRGAGRFSYHAAIKADAELQACESGSLAEFALERYTGFFCRGKSPYVFRAWHPPWLQTPMNVTVEEDSLLTAKFPWFKAATLGGANFAPRFERVWLGRAHRLDKAVQADQASRRVLSAFYDMP